MNNKEEMLRNLHKIFRKDSYITELLKAAGIDLDKISTEADGIKTEMFFDTMTEKGILIYQKELDYIPKSITLEGKRIEIESRYKSSGKCDLILLQKIADTWNAGLIIVRFVNGIIQLAFSGEVQKDYDLQGLKKAIDEIKPAHLGSEFIYSERLDGVVYLNAFNTEEIEEDFIEKNKTIDIECKYYNGVFNEIEEVIENYGI